MCVFASFVPITIFLGLAYLVWAQLDAQSGARRKLGKIVIVWLLVFSVMLLGGSIRATVTGQCPLTKVMEMETSK